MSTYSNNTKSYSSLSSGSKYRNLRILGLEDSRKAAYTLQRSFKHDSLSQLLVCHVKDKDERDELEFALYEAYTKQHIMKGLVLGINESKTDFETVAMWSLPESAENGLDSFATLMRAGYSKLWDLHNDIGREKIFDGMLPLLHDTAERIMTTDSRFLGKNMYTLVYLGSLEKARGKGNVRLMFDFMFEKFVDKDSNSICYLESSSKTNIPIYEKFGFKFYQDIVLGSRKGSKSVEGRDYAVMNVMIRDTRGRDWTVVEPEYSTSKL